MDCEGAVLYVGISPDPLRRFVHHQSGKSRFSRMRRPLELLACFPVGPHREAARQERRLKRQSRQGKLAWVRVVRQTTVWNQLVKTHGELAFVAKARTNDGDASANTSPSKGTAL